MDDPSTSTQALPAGTRLEEFVIERVLGSGGFGITYLARDTALGRQVVIKENLPVQFCFRDTHSLTVAPRHTHGDDADNFQWSLENFSKEAAMLASLDHPGIVRVHRSFQAFGTAYFVMPFVEGLALDELAKDREGKPFSEEELRGLVERVLGALGYLHDRGIYHRDLKPGNLLITREGIPVLIDFGSARQRLSERSMTVVESPGYTPFEQLQTRGNIGPWSDLYALGATLVKLMTGEAPPKTNDRSFGDPWRPLIDRADLAGKFSVGFLKGIDRSLKLQIEERWQNAGEWRAALRGETVALPVAATPEHVPVTVSVAVASASATESEKKTNFVPWVVATCMVLGLIAVGKSVSNERAGVVAAQVRDAEQLENQKLITQAKAKEEADAMEAEWQNVVRAEQEGLAKIAQEKAKAEVEAKAEKQRAALAEQEKQALIAQAKAKEEAEAIASPPSLPQMLARLNGFSVDFRFKEAMAYLKSLPVNPSDKARSSLLAVAELSDEFLLSIEQDLVKQAATVEMKLKSGEVMTKISMDSQKVITVTSTDGRQRICKWSDLTPDSLIALHRVLMKNQKTELERQIRRHECAVAFDWLAGNRERAFTAAATLSQSSESYKKRWSQISAGLPK